MCCAVNSLYDFARHIIPSSSLFFYSSSFSQGYTDRSQACFERRVVKALFFIYSIQIHKFAGFLFYQRITRWTGHENWIYSLTSRSLMSMMYPSLDIMIPLLMMRRLILLVMRYHCLWPMVPVTFHTWQQIIRSLIRSWMYKRMRWWTWWQMMDWEAVQDHKKNRLVIRSVSMMRMVRMRRCNLNPLPTRCFSQNHKLFLCLLFETWITSRRTRLSTTSA